MSVTIRNEIVIINDAGLAALDGVTSFALSPRRCYVLAADYNGTKTWTFQAVVQNQDAGTARYVRLVNSNDDTEATITVPASTTSWTLMEAAFEGGKPDDTYPEKAVIGETSDADCLVARIICKQVTGNGLTSKATLIEIGDYGSVGPPSVASQYAPTSYSFPWEYTAAKWDPTPTFLFEAVAKVLSTKNGITVALEESDSNQTFAAVGSISPLAEAIIAFTTSDSTQTELARTSSGFTPTDGRLYRLVWTGDSSKYSEALLVAAKIAMKQSGTITKFEENHFFGVGSLSKGETTGSPNPCYIEIDSTFWSGVTKNYYMEHYADNSSNQTKVQEYVGGSWQDVVNSPITGSGLQRGSSSMSLGDYDHAAVRVNDDA